MGHGERAVALVRVAQTFGAGFCNVQQRIGTCVTESLRIRGMTDAKRVEHENEGAAHLGGTSVSIEKAAANKARV